MVPRTLKPHTRFTSNSATFSFYLGDCVDILEQLEPGSIDAIVTSPPYNLGIRYRSYDDTMPRSQYLEWTGEWVSRAARAMAADGSLFLNVGRQADRPVDGHRHRAGHSPPSAAAEHDSLDQVDRD